MTAVVCIVLDVGVHMTTDIDASVDCLKSLIHRKFFAQKKEEIALLLCGTAATDNHLADEDGYFSNISTVRELSPIDWDLLEFLNSNDLLSTDEGDLIAGIIVGVDHLVTKCKNRKGILEKRVIVVSNLAGPINNSNLRKVVKNLRIAEIQLSLIGCKVDEKRGELPSTSNQAGPSNGGHQSKIKPGLDVFSQLWSELDGESYTFDEAIPALSLFETRSVSQRGWKVDLQLGDSVSIPVEGFTQVREARPPPLSLLYAANPETPIRTVTTYHARNENATQLDISDVVRGYQYGSTMVPFSEADQSAIKSNSEKTLSLISFTEASNVPRNYYVGDSVLVFVANSPTENSPVTVSLAALAQAMYELNAVGLVRRVYNRVSAPRLGVLSPHIRGTQISLVYTDLAFAEDVRGFQFPSLPLSSYDSTSGPTSNQKAPSDKQLKAMNNLVDSMLFTSDSDDEESDQDRDYESLDESMSRTRERPVFHPERVPNPWIQRLFTCFRERGLNPTQQLLPSTSNSSPHHADWLDPRSLPGLESIIAYLGSQHLQGSRRNLVSNMPELSSGDRIDGEQESSVTKRRRLMTAELFGIQETPETTFSNISINPSSFGDTAPQAPDVSVADVGIVDPIGDFQKLIAHGRVDYAIERIQNRIIQLVTDPYTGSILRPKAVALLRDYRERAAQTARDSEHDLTLARAYNLFIRKWREELDARSALSQGPTAPISDACLSFWRDTICQDLGLLCDSDIPGFEITRTEATAFLNPPEVAFTESSSIAQTNPKPGTTPHDDVSLDNLMDEMD